MDNNRRICIIDYGSGNVRSVFNIFQSIGPNVKVSNKLDDINNATHIVLPGVGAFGSAMDKIHKLDILDILKKNVFEYNKPFLGICVGMQILSDEGYEHGTHRGLGWINGKVKKMEIAQDLVLPHMGWNNLKITNRCSLLEGIGSDMDFYFVHSYYFDSSDPQVVKATFEYGKEFTAVIAKEKIFGVQFHPEKSQKAGKIILENFLKL